jgi:hypothetical protein
MQQKVLLQDMKLTEGYSIAVFHWWQLKVRACPP